MATQRRTCIACHQYKERVFSIPRNETNAARWFESLGITDPNLQNEKKVRLHVCDLHFHPDDLTGNELSNRLVIPYSGTPAQILQLRPTLQQSTASADPDEANQPSANLIDPMSVSLFDDDNMENGFGDAVGPNLPGVGIEEDLLSNEEEMAGLLDNAEIEEEPVNMVRLETRDFIGLLEVLHC
jgi:hypothetical protein